MTRAVRRIALSFVPTTFAALVLFVPTAAPVPTDLGLTDLELQNVSLACSDGTNLALALDTTAVTQLTGAVTAINLFPAGDPALTCSVKQSGLASSSATFSDSASSSSGNPNKDYTVGGGQVLLPFGSQSCPSMYTENFGLSAHVNAGTTTQKVGGTFNLTTSSSPANPAACAGHLVSKIVCLNVTSSANANFKAVITKATGAYAAVAASNTFVDGIVTDNGQPSGGVPDTLDWGATNAQPSSGRCSNFIAAGTPLVNGNISVHQAS